MGVSRIHRLLRLITLLQSGRPRSAAELMQELEISRRTLFRDLNMLQEAGVPYYYDPSLGYRISESYFLPPVNLTVPETLGLMMLGKTAAAVRGRPMVGQALSAIYKLLSTVPQPIREACGDLMDNVSVDGGAQLQSSSETQHYTLLQQCIDEGRICRVRYQSPVEAEPLVCDLHPYALHFANRAWYLMGKTDVHDEVRILKLARFESIEATDSKFRKPRSFRPEHKLANAWQLIPGDRDYAVELEFTPRVAQNVMEVRWHHTQKQKLLDDGRCRMSFTVTGLHEIAWWICGYADQVKVLKPAELRDIVQAKLESALKNYCS